MSRHAEIAQFDYGSLSAEASKACESHAAAIRQRVGKTLRLVCEMGEHLAAVRSLLPDQKFSEWLRWHFGWKRRTAYNCISVYEQFGKHLCKICTGATFAPAAAYLLAAQRVPAEARQQAIDEAERGDVITVARAKEIIAAFRPVPQEWSFFSAVEAIHANVEKTWAKALPEQLPALSERLRALADMIDTEVGCSAKDTA